MSQPSEVKRPGLIVGIDVDEAGSGYHGAVLAADRREIEELFHFYDASDVVRHLERVISHTKRPLSAISLNLSADADANGELKMEETLWSLLRASPIMKEGVALLESLPRTIADHLYDCDVSLPLRLLTDESKRSQYSHYMDASVLSWMAGEYVTRDIPDREKKEEPGSSRPPVQTAVPHTLCIPVDESGGRILLGLKKRGFGKGLINGFGGKIHTNENETAFAAANRELMEEAHVHCTDMKEAGRLYFTFADGTLPIEGYVYRCESLVGEPAESNEMKPRWYDLSSIPFENMWDDDVFWFPVFLEKKDFSAYFHFDENRQLQYRSLHLL